MKFSSPERYSAQRYASVVGLFTLLLALYNTLVRQHHVLADQLVSDALRKRNEQSQDCGFPGSSDLYGLGIRVGLYLQTMALWLSCNVIRRKRAEQNAISVIFLISMMLILVISSIRRSIHAAEAFVLLQMVILTWYMGPVFDGNRPSYLLHRGGLEAKLICEVVIGIGVIYNIWFWWKGLDELQPTTCGTFGFVLFWKFDLYGGIRIVHKVMSIIVALEVPQRFAWHCVGLRLLWNTRSIRLTQQLADRLAKDSWASRTDEKCNLNDSGDVKTGGIVYISEGMAKADGNATFPINQFDLSALNTILPNMTLEHVIEADSFITDITKVFDEQLNELTRGYYTKWGVTVVIPKLRTTIGIFCRATWDLARLALRDSAQFWSLITLLLALRAQGRLRIRVELQIAVSAIVRDQRFNTFDWRVLYVVAQRRAARLPKANAIDRALTASALGLFFCTFQILVVELTIKWNHMSGLNDWLSVSQFVPLVGGAGSLCRVMYFEIKHVSQYGRLSLFSAESNREIVSRESIGDEKV